MRYFGSLGHIIDMVSNYITGRVPGESAIDRSDTRIDRQRRIIGLVLFIIFILLPASFLLLALNFPDLFKKWFG
jgi:hypothetical protein